MRWSKTVKAPAQRITGCVLPIQVAGEDEPITLVCARPDPRARRDALKDIQVLIYHARRFDDAGEAFLKGEADQAPREVWGEDAARPLLEYVSQHVTEVLGVVDEDTGEALDWAELEDAERMDFLGVVLDGLALVHVASEVCQSNGLGKPIAERLKKYADVEIVRGGCKCQACTVRAERTRDCLVYDLAPLDDVMWCIAQHNALLRGGAESPGPDTPQWLEEIHAILMVARAEVADRKRREEEQRAIAKKHGLIP